MGNLKDRESRRRASVVGSIIEQQPSGETMQRSTSRGRPKEDRELRKRAEKEDQSFRTAQSVRRYSENCLCRKAQRQ